MYCLYNVSPPFSFNPYPGNREGEMIPIAGSYTSCEFAMVDCHRFAVGILMIYVIVWEILVLPVSWLPSWIFDTR